MLHYASPSDYRQSYNRFPGTNHLITERHNFLAGEGKGTTCESRKDDNGFITWIIAVSTDDSLWTRNKHFLSPIYVFS
ncbi:unnamed protein product [Orchesella dallaii]|uniref:Uncharacterized protein n=1 Tax=Orchesella dallaii TaxID=48710 RepID=A0ABP1QZD5_9HEXA